MPKSFVVRIVLFCCVISFAATTAAPCYYQQKSGDLRLEPYSLVTGGGGQKIDAELGWLTVPENRSNSSSRLIQLAFVRLKSTVQNPGPPTIYLVGGPGGSGIDAAKGPCIPFVDGPAGNR